MGKAPYRRNLRVVEGEGRDPELWRQHAMCKPDNMRKAGIPVMDYWFPTDGMPAQPARDICATCPVAMECLLSALEVRPRDGIWAGLNYRDRQRYRRLFRTTSD